MKVVGGPNWQGWAILLIIVAAFVRSCAPPPIGQGHA